VPRPWVFLFDSFDEIPEVLSSTETDEVIAAYSDAIDDFLSGINYCRGVIASRGYRGPRRHPWCKFRVLELSPAHQAQMVRLSFMDHSGLAGYWWRRSQLRLRRAPW
jgi:hypothetical protein